MSGVLPLIDLSGSHIERGLQYGRACEERILRTADFYADGLGMSLSRFIRLGHRFEPVIASFEPSYAEEVRAIARGARVDPGLIFAINARTEIRSVARYRDECSSLASPKDDLLAQNWDWGADQEQLMVLLRATHPDGHVTLCMAEPGMLGKIGLNSAGFGVCLNALTCYRELRGVPVHILLRAALDARSFGEAERMLSRPHGTASNILVSGGGRFLNVEHARDRVFSFSGSTAFVHTNHYLGADITDRSSPKHRSTFARHARMRQLMRYRHNLADAKRILFDRAGEFPIQQPIAEHGSWGRYGTVCTIIMRPGAGEFHITEGNPVENGFRTVCIR